MSHAACLGRCLAALPSSRCPSVVSLCLTAFIQKHMQGCTSVAHSVGGRCPPPPLPPSPSSCGSPSPPFASTMHTSPVLRALVMMYISPLLRALVMMYTSPLLRALVMMYTSPLLRALVIMYTSPLLRALVMIVESCIVTALVMTYTSPVLRAEYIFCVLFHWLLNVAATNRTKGTALLRVLLAATPGQRHLIKAAFSRSDIILVNTVFFVSKCRDLQFHSTSAGASYVPSEFTEYRCLP